MSSGPSKEKLALSLGAFSYIDSSATSVVDVMENLGGANLIISTSPEVSSISALAPAVARNGTITVISSPTDGGRLEVEVLPMVIKRATIRGWTCGTAPDTEECIRFSLMKGLSCIENLQNADHTTDTGIKPMVKTWPLEDYAKAYKDTMRGGPRFQNVITL